MATTKPKKTPVRKPAAKKAPIKKKPVSKKTVVRSTAVTRRRLISRSDHYSQTTWVLISVWLILIAIFLGTVIGRWG